MFPGHIKNGMKAAIVVTYLALFANFQLCTTSNADPITEVSVENGRLTVNANEISLSAILETISEKTGIEFKSLTELKMAKVKFSDLPIEAGLKRLLKPYSYSFVYEDAVGDSTAAAIRQVFVFEELQPTKRNTGVGSNSPIGKTVIPEESEIADLVESTYGLKELPAEPVFPDAPEGVDEKEIEQLRSMMAAQRLGDMDSEIQAVMEGMSDAGWQDQEAIAAAVKKLRKEIKASSKTHRPDE